MSGISEEVTERTLGVQEVRRRLQMLEVEYRLHIRRHLLPKRRNCPKRVVFKLHITRTAYSQLNKRDLRCFGSPNMHTFFNFLKL